MVVVKGCGCGKGTLVVIRGRVMVVVRGLWLW